MNYDLNKFILIDFEATTVIELGVKLAVSDRPFIYKIPLTFSMYCFGAYMTDFVVCITYFKIKIISGKPS